MNQFLKIKTLVYYLKIIKFYYPFFQINNPIIRFRLFFYMQ